MRACTLNKLLEKHTDMRVYISIKGTTYELGKVFTFDDVLDDDGNLKTPGKIVLFPGEPKETKQETKSTE